MNFKPLHDYILVQYLQAEQTTAGGIIIADSAKQVNQRGTVVAVGPFKYVDGKAVDLSVKPGDIVLFSAYSPIDLTLNGKEYGILRDRDLIGVFE